MNLALRSTYSYLCRVKENIAVYGASSADIDPRFADDARTVGRLIAGAGLGVVCGGGRQGLMAAAIEGAVDSGGCATGVLPAFMIERGWQHPQLTRTVSTDGMHERKKWMLTHSRGVIALAGGTGTLEELFEAITWRQLGLWSGQIVILNTLDYYRPLLEMLDRSIEMHFMRGDHAGLWQTALTPAEAVEMVMRPVTTSEFSQKIR